MEDKQMEIAMSMGSSDSNQPTESFHIKRAMSCALATDIENFFLIDDFPNNLNSYTQCERWLVRVYWKTDLLDAEMRFLEEDRRKVKRGEKSPCYEKEDWCYSFKRRIIQQYETLPAREYDGYLDISMRSPDVRKDDNIIFSNWADIAED